MRYPACEKIKIIRLVEQSSLPVRRTLAQIGVPRAAFCRWYDLYQTGDPEAVEEHPGRPSWVWNRIPEDVRASILEMALEPSELSPRQLGVRFTDSQGYFVSEASVYRLLKSHGLITSPAFIVMKAAKAFTDKTTAPNQMWQTGFTHFKIIGWGWVYLSTILDDFSRYRRLEAVHGHEGWDVTDTLELALSAPGCDQVSVRDKARLLSDNGSSYISGELADWLGKQEMKHVRRAALSSPDPGQDRALAPDPEEPHPAGKRLPARDLETQIGTFIEHYNHARYHGSLENVTPADAYFDRAADIVRRRASVKRQTLEHRRVSRLAKVALTQSPRLDLLFQPRHTA
jgi:putative transposase